MIPEPISSFIINIVASVTLGTYEKLIKRNAEQELVKIVDEVLKLLIKNSIIRDFEKRDFLKLLKQYTENPVQLPKEYNNKYVEFKNTFNSILPSYQKATNFILLLKQDKSLEILQREISQRYNEEKQQLEQNIKELRELRDFDELKFQELNKKLKKLDIQKTIHLTQINELRKVNEVIEEKLYKKAFDLFSQGKIDEALSVLNEPNLRKDEKILDKKKKELANRRLLKARLLVLKNNYNEAFTNFEQAIKLYNHPVNIIEYANLLVELNYIDLAISKFKTILKLLKDTPKEKTEKELVNTAKVLNKLGTLYAEKNEITNAKEKLKEAYSIFIKLSSKKNYLLDASYVLGNLAKLHIIKNEYLQANEKYEEAINILRSLEKNEDILSVFAFLLRGLANMQVDIKDYKQANDSFDEALSIYKNLAINKPEEYMNEVATTMNDFARLFSVRNEIEKATITYNSALSIYIDLVNGNSIQLPFMEGFGSVLNNFALLLAFKTNKIPMAINYFEQALFCFRELSLQNPNGFLPKVASVLNNLGLLYQIKDREYALTQYNEALLIYEKLKKTNPYIFLPDIAGNLFNSMPLYVLNNEKQKANENYNEAVIIYKKLIKDFPKVYEIEYARILIRGVYFLKKDKNNLVKAKKILLKHSNTPIAVEHLKLIENLE